MNKIVLIVSAVAGGLALLILSVFLFLAMNGKLNMQTLSQIPVLGGFFGKPPLYEIKQIVEAPPPTVVEEEPPAPVEDNPPLAHFTVPAPYNVKQLELLVNEFTDAKAAVDLEKQELARQREDLEKREKEYEERWNEMQTIMEKAAEVPKQIKEANYKNIIAIVGEIKDGANAASILKDYDVVDATNVLLGIFDSKGPKKAAEILVELKKIDEEFGKRVQNRLTTLQQSIK